ncbi:MAG: NADH-quinone oxidoreductase subunit C [Ignavibacteriae bacterium HGW-Ignavibacteriae-3]|nr:MAG: NADH-quinone oxidoreductase subunit C [Ignavibacteriae bacterium HGW-Ignavibacteriae-3]
MKNPEEIYELLKKEFNETIFGLDKDTPVENIISVDPMNIHKIGAFLKDNEELKFDSLMVLSGVDDANGTKVKDEDGTEVITGGTLSVYYHLHSTVLKHKITIKTSAPRENPEVESVYDVWRTSDWHEREAFDMFGIIFKNHPDLTRILMPYDWDAGYPLRKDYKNPEFYQGMKVPY